MPLTNVANAQTLTLTLFSASDGANTNNVAVPMSVLVGDTNGDRFVNSGDALQTRSRSGQGTNATNFRSDVNADGVINSGDTTAVRAKSGCLSSSRSSVVLPLPRKPVSTATGIMRADRSQTVHEDQPLLLESVFGATGTTGMTGMTGGITTWAAIWGDWLIAVRL